MPFLYDCDEGGFVNAAASGLPANSVLEVAGGDAVLEVAGGNTVVEL